MEKRSFLIVANPESGSKKAVKYAKRLQELLSQKGLTHKTIFTEKEVNTTDLVREKSNDGFTDVIVIGGDGTINQAVNGLEKDLCLSIIPAGSGNDFIKNINLGVSFEEQIATILDGSIRKIDVGLCNGRKFVNGVGIGFDGQIVYEMLHRKTLLKGHAAYYYHVLRILASYIERTFLFTVESSELRKEELILMTIGNGTTFGGGFKLTPNALLDDGKLDICFVGKLSPFKRFLNVSRLSNGTHLTLPEIWEERTTEIEISENDLLEGHIDGEYLGKPPFQIRLVPKSLSIRVSSF